MTPPTAEAPSSMRIVLADDESLLLSTLAQILELQPGIEVVARAGTGQEAITAAITHRPDVALVDLEMPDADGIAVVEALAPHGIRTVIITRHARPTLLRRALQAGAAGFILKSTTSEELTDILWRVHRGERYLAPDIAALAMTALDCPLSDRELEILGLIRSGLGSAEIAQRLHLAGGTIRNYVSSALTKLDVPSGRAAADRAYAEGWI